MDSSPSRAVWPVLCRLAIPAGQVWLVHRGKAELLVPDLSRLQAQRVVCGLRGMAGRAACLALLAALAGLARASTDPVRRQIQEL